MTIHLNTLRRMEAVAEITRKYYEPERLDRCYKAVWRKYVYPVYPMSYRTYLRYIGVGCQRLMRQREAAQK